MVGMMPRIPEGLRARLPALAALLLVSVVAFSFGFVPLRASHDEWWHLKTGQWILDHHRLPLNDIFTYTGENIRWHNHEWLSQILFYKIYEWGDRHAIGDLRAMLTFRAFVVALTFALVAVAARIASRSWGVAALVGVVMADISRRAISPRPPILSYLLFAAFLIVLMQWKRGRLRGRWLWALPVVSVLWANLHGMVLLGIAATGAYAGGEVLEWLAARVDVWWRNRRSAASSPAAAFPWRPVSLLSGVTLACIAAATINPAGAALFTLSRKFMTDPVLQRTIAEMLPTPGLILRFTDAAGIQQWMFSPISVSFWATVALLAVLFLVNRGRLRCGADYILTGFFLNQAVMHWRLLPLFGIAAAGSFAYLIHASLLRAGLWRRPRMGVAIFAVASTLGAVYVFAVGEPPPQTFARRNADLWRGKTHEPSDYPAPMMQFIVDTQLPDRMFSESNYCGYAIWRLSPEYHKLFTDNRFDVFGSKFFRLETAVLNALPAGVEFIDGERLEMSWSEILDHYGVNFIMVSREQKLNQALRDSRAWRLIYYFAQPDDPPTSGFNIWLRNDPAFAAVVERARRNFRTQNPMKQQPDTMAPEPVTTSTVSADAFETTDTQGSDHP
ncbi:hypothetical protein CVU37_05315 [candidate division BRC1 bacterium HGW-BRC1-1]|jgi:hypothetical protein|nr:MAG: hypothetical protein CVU37_05315 [candidate division BRC1 bacterium HGW-BRC1-1]